LVGDGVLHAPPQLLFDLSEFRSHAIAARLALELEGSPPRLAADEREPQEGEGLRFAEPTLLASLGRMATKLQQAGLFPV
jgi:hypothetical protein